MKRLVFALPGNEQLASKIRNGINGQNGEFIIRQFPDKETYIRILSDVAEQPVIVVCTLHQPDDKLLPLFFLCKLLKDLKVKNICIVAPYLSYMRQDKAFNSGEAITSNYFAALLSSFVDQLITIDPHLHRRNSLKEIYSIPCEALHAANLISSWIKKNIPNAVIIGPDEESEQWVAEVAKNAGVPFIVLQKIRHGDSDVEVSVPNVATYKNHTPVLVDDIISTARTMIETIHHLAKEKMNPAICIGVHAVFAGDAYKSLLNSGVKEVITCNTISHESNGIDVSDMLIDALKKLA
ncbi:MAG: ribose-phosphate pyrophosphokinase [Bacteroidia bacterium]